jgi:hypothetical protein
MVGIFILRAIYLSYLIGKPKIKRCFREIRD